MCIQTKLARSLISVTVHLMWSDTWLSIWLNSSFTFPVWLLSVWVSQIYHNITLNIAMLQFWCIWCWLISWLQVKWQIAHRPSGSTVPSHFQCSGLGLQDQYKTQLDHKTGKICGKGVFLFPSFIRISEWNMFWMWKSIVLVIKTFLRQSVSVDLRECSETLGT